LSHSFSRQNETIQQAIELAPIVKESIRFLRATLPATIIIEQYIQLETPMVLADPTHIHQVLMNLCTNASHAMQDQGGILKIELKQFDLSEKDASMYHDIDPGNYTELLVGDSGHGMNRELQQRIFDPFFTTKEQGDGTGLGLSVVHGIVTQIGGTIKVDSTLGKGSIFRILFPAEKGFEENGASREKIANISGGNEHILLVDDEKMLLEMGKKFLQYYGYRVTTCACATDALKLFNKHPYDFDLVVTDQVMPRMTGGQLIRELLKIRSDIPIFLTTGYSEALSKRQALAIGASAFIMKPIIMEELATTIRETLDKE
jgi:CheY-like chemotaxis protein